MPKHIRKELPFFDALCWAAIILMPQMILGVRHVFWAHWVGTGSNVSMDNFLHNASSYGVDFLMGRVHPVVLTLSAMWGWVVIYRREKKVAVVLAGWLLLLSLTYFSMWFQNYGETRGMFLKTRLFGFFYPPLVLCAAGGLVWAAERYALHNKVFAAAVLCGIIMAWTFFIIIIIRWVRINLYWKCGWWRMWDKWLLLMTWPWLVSRRHLQALCRPLWPRI